MSNSVLNKGNRRKVAQQLQKKNKIGKSRCKSPVLWILVGAVLVTGSAIANSWMDITGKNTIPVKPSVAPQNEISEPKMPRLSPFVPVIDA